MAAISKTVILVGCGNMGRAMLQGWIGSGCLAPSDVHVVEPTDQLRDQAAALNVHVHNDHNSLPDALSPSLIIFAVKPQVMFEVTLPYTAFVKKGAAVLSVAAGIKTAKFSNQFGDQAAIIRVMPNTPAAISKGMMVIFNNHHVTDEQRIFVEALMGASGAVTTINDEALMDAVTAVSGSGPAYIFHMIEALTSAGTAAGLPDDVAKLLAEQTVYGAACYAKQSDEGPGILRQQVTSPNGTTAAALDVLMSGDGLTDLMTRAVMAAKKRSQELG